MPALQMPQREVQGLLRLRELSEEQIKELHAVLSQLPISIDRNKLVDASRPSLRTIDSELFEQILNTLLGMYSTRLKFDLSEEQFAELVCDAMERTSKPDLKLSPDERQSFKSLLERFLQIEPLIYPSKSVMVLLEHERVFVHGRMLTDIRSIFGPEVKNKPPAAVIFHMLHMTYRQDDQDKSFSVALDGRDVEKLIATLTRALEKQSTLITLLESADIACLIPE